MSTVETVPERTATLARGPAPAVGRRSQLRIAKRVAAVLLLLVALGGLFVAWLPDPVLVDEVYVQRGPMHVTVDEDGRSRVRLFAVVHRPNNVSTRTRRTPSSSARLTTVGLGDPDVSSAFISSYPSCRVALQPTVQHVTH